MRYVRQPDRYSCGPIAILNAMKWAGLDVTTRGHLPYLQFGCRTIDQEDPYDLESNGTTNTDFDRVLRYVAKGTFEVKRSQRPSIPKMIKHLKNGGAIVLVYHWDEDNDSGDHFLFIAGFKKGCFVTVNDHRSTNENTVANRTPKTLRKWLKRGIDYPLIWLLTQNE